MLNNNIICPNCGHQFPMEHSIREEIQKEYRAKWIDAQKKKEEEYAQKDNQLQLQQQQQKLAEALDSNITITLRPRA